MTREEDKHRAAAYVPPGPVRITSTALESEHHDLVRRVRVLEEQVKSLQLAMPKGIPA